MTLKIPASSGLPRGVQQGDLCLAECAVELSCVAVSNGDRLRGSKNAAHQAAVKAWAGERPEPDVFAKEILPGLRSLPIAALVAATGLSEHYCSLIRLGKRVPHPRHWNALRGISLVVHEG